MAEENCSAVLLEFKVARSRSKDRTFPGATLFQPTCRKNLGRIRWKFMTKREYIYIYIRVRTNELLDTIKYKRNAAGATWWAKLDSRAVYTRPCRNLR